jgi:hypothetical protein
MRPCNGECQCCGCVATVITKLKGQCHEIFDVWFFSWICCPKPLSIPLGQFRIFSRKFAEIFAAQGAPPVSLTPVVHSGTEVVLVREGPRAGGGLLTAEKGF